MDSISDRIDELTLTFTRDSENCDSLFQSGNAEAVGDLLLSHLWANASMPICYESLSGGVPGRFGAGEEMAHLWNTVLTDSISRDLRLVPYLVIRGLTSEASTPLRRALENVGVLSHIWTHPTKVEALADTNSAEYNRAFRREVDSRRASSLRAAGTSKRFETMTMGAGATLLYSALSEFDIHGGTAHRFFSISEEPSGPSCSFLKRPLPSSERTEQQISFLSGGHLAVCGEVVGLCATYGERSDKLLDAAEQFSVLAATSTDKRLELQHLKDTLWRKLGMPRNEISH